MQLNSLAGNIERTYQARNDAEGLKAVYEADALRRQNRQLLEQSIISCWIMTPSPAVA